MSDNVKRTLGGREVTFGPMNLGFIKRNTDLLRKVGNNTGFADLVEQQPIFMESLRVGMGAKMPTEKQVDEFSVPEVTEALVAALEASGMLLRTIPAGEAVPAKV